MSVGEVSVTLTVDTAEYQRRLGRVLRSALEPVPRPRGPRWPWVLALVAFAIGFFAGARVHAAEPKIALLVRPTIMIQRRGDIHVEARIPRDADNRLLAIAWTSDGGSAGESQRPLEGDDAPVLHTLWLPSQPAAHYLFVATLINKLGKVAGTARAEIHVPDVDSR